MILVGGAAGAAAGSGASALPAPVLPAPVPQRQETLMGADGDLTQEELAMIAGARSGVRGALDMLCAQEDGLWEANKVLTQIVANIVKNPHEPKFRWPRLATAAAPAAAAPVLCVASQHW